MAFPADLLSVVSLVISIIAFVVAVAQALQQFASSADGYRRCKEGIMGLWGKQTRRRFTLDEFRFKVVFKSPVLFVARPDNPFGPLDGPIYCIDGSDDSYAATHCRTQEDIDTKKKVAKVESGQSRKMQVHTADDELATWVGLLESLQKAERSGRQWEQQQSQTSVSRKRYGPINSGLVVQIQERKRDWGAMPDGVQKPFATSTVSHIVEMAVMLGMVWRNFDQDDWNLRAEGNGYILLSQTVWGLGISVAFTVTGKARFETNRPIPCHALQELVFGTVPTVFKGLALGYEPISGDWEKHQITRQTLRQLGCDRVTIKRYFTRHNHIRSVNFELIAMLAPAFRMRGSLLRRLPNPTPDPWITSVSASSLIMECVRCVNDLAPNSKVTPQIEFIQRAWADQLAGLWNVDDDTVSLDMLEAAHDVLDACDDYLQGIGHDLVQSIVGAHVISVIAEVNDPSAFLSSVECDTEEELFDQYFTVIRQHVINFKVAAESKRNNVGQQANLLSPASTIHRESLFDAAARLQVDVQDIWITLMFRMCCWWLLHDFDETDVMIVPPRLKYSRLPIYIL